MKLKQSAIAFGVAVSLIVFGAFGSAGAAPSPTCDRQCLVNFMQQYLAALVKHDPKAVPLAGNAKFTENEAVIPIGKGLWETASGAPSDFQIYAADPVEQAVACLVIMKETDKDIILGARLKFADGKITEAEHLVARGNVNISQPGLQKPRPGLLEDVTKSDRMKRDELIKIGLSYYDALTGEDGTLAPFAEECERHENGMTSAGGKPPDPKAFAAAKPPAAKLNPDQEK